MSHSRRNFIKKSLFSTAILLPTAVQDSFSGFSPLKRESKATQPTIISTWNHGTDANAKAWEVLQRSGSIVDAVEEGVKVTEADITSRSVGLNGHPDREGIVTLDASIMAGNGECGSVCFLRQIKHPISVARKVMEETPHVLLAGEGARQFAMASGFDLEEEVLHPDVAREYEEWKENEEYRPIINIENHDTIGMVGVDELGNLAGACTTSGLAYKMHGRVGDSPIIGAGLYVDGETGAATATGMGETIIKICGSFLVVELMRQGRTPQEACEEAIYRLIEKNRDNIDNTQAAFIAVNKQGDYGAYAVHPGFNYAVKSQDKEELIDSRSEFSG